MTDLQLSQKINNIVYADYITAVEFIEVNPDHTLVLFRKILTHICKVVGDSRKIKFKNNILDKQIKQLHIEEIIDLEFSDLLHNLRRYGNTGAHEKYNTEESDEEFIRNSKKRLLDNAKNARKLTVNIFIKTIYLLSNKKIHLADIDLVTIGEQEHKQILFDAVISNSPAVKLKAGLLYESMAENEFEKNILYTKQDALFHIQSLYKSAAACYEVGYKASCNVEEKLLTGTINITRDTVNKIIYRDCDLEPLFKYSLILTANLDGSNQEETGYKYLKIASDRGHAEATAHYAAYIYDELKNYELVFEYLQKDNVQDVALTHRILCHYYKDGHGHITDKSMALTHIKKAIELNCHDSLFTLGEAYHTGSFVDKNDALAEEFLLRAIEAGNIQARKYYLFVFKKGAELIAKQVASRFKNLNKALKNKPITGTKKPKRNEPCPCGSEKKYKHCCA